MKIGFMGGTFSPPHKGHLNAAKVFYEEEDLDKLIIIPSAVSPFKVSDEKNATDRQRFEMAYLCFSKLMDEYGYNIEVSDMEQVREGISYTFLTVRELKELYPKDELIMYVGSDMFLSLEKWKNAEEIFSCCKIYTRCRENGEMQQMVQGKKKYEQLYGANIVISDHKEVIVSSTQVRNEVSAKNLSNYKNLLTDEVFRYIINNRLYFQE